MESGFGPEVGKLSQIMFEIVYLGVLFFYWSQIKNESSESRNSRRWIIEPKVAKPGQIRFEIGI